MQREALSGYVYTPFKIMLCFLVSFLAIMNGINRADPLAFQT